MGMGRWTVTGDKFLEMDQIERLVSYLRDQRDLSLARGKNTQAVRDYYAIRFLLESGVRVFEFCNLLGADFNGQKVTVRTGKGGKPRTVLLTKSTTLMLKEWVAVKHGLGFNFGQLDPLFPSRYNRLYTTRGVQKRVKIIFEAANLPSHLSVHSLRHTYCSLLLASGKVSLATVKENLGHHSIAVTNLYSHAVGDLSDVILYSDPGSQKADLSEPRTHAKPKKPNDFIKTYLRNVNLKR